MNNGGPIEPGLLHAKEGDRGYLTGTKPIDDILPPVRDEDFGQAGAKAAESNPAPAAGAIVEDGIDAATLSTTPPGELVPGPEEPVAPEL